MSGHEQAVKRAVVDFSPCLVINAGSSSVKFSVFDLVTDTQIYKDSLERVEVVEEAIKQIPEILRRENIGQIKSIGHRVAHGGNAFRDAAYIDDQVIEVVKNCIPLAPLHNPPILAGILMARKNWPDVPQIAVFDTAFHQTIPDFASTYAVPENWRKMGLQRYGFHGTSHKYVMQRVAQELDQRAEDLRIISCHLGNGASICAIDHGCSVDTSMGMTPLEGLVMGTRSGDVDPGLFAFLQREANLNSTQVEKILYEDSGLKALSGLGNDMRDIEVKAKEGDAKARLALDVYAYRVRKYIGAYAAVMNGCDVLAFTGGIGENSIAMRAAICKNLDCIGLELDSDKNEKVALQTFEAPQLQNKNSKIKIIVTQTREQWMIAQETARILQEENMLSPNCNLSIPR